MGPTFLMSHPGPDWRIRGGENFRSQARAATNPRRAMEEWLALADAITTAGGRILVMPPAETSPPLTGMVYTANAGQLFPRPTASGQSEWVYLVSRMSVEHRKPERAPVARFLREAGLEVRESAAVWEGQADVQRLPGGRFVLTWGVRSERASLDEVRALLPPGARVLDLRLREPFFHGDTCLDALNTRAGDTVLLVYGDAFEGDALAELRGFVDGRTELLRIDREDALGYACNALGVAGTVLCPAGLSVSLRGQLARRGFPLVELDLAELFGKGGGGPRCLVNDLPGLTITASAPDYASLREALVARAATYPETAPTD